MYPQKKEDRKKAGKKGEIKKYECVVSLPCVL